MKKIFCTICIVALVILNYSFVLAGGTETGNIAVNNENTGKMGGTIQAAGAGAKGDQIATGAVKVQDAKTKDITINNKYKGPQVQIKGKNAQGDQVAPGGVLIKGGQ